MGFEFVPIRQGDDSDGPPNCGWRMKKRNFAKKVVQGPKKALPGTIPFGAKTWLPPKKFQLGAEPKLSSSHQKCSTDKKVVVPDLKSSNCGSCHQWAVARGEGIT